MNLARAIAPAPLLLVLLAACGGSSPAPTYSVGGTISGLAASGLSLANGGDTVTPASGATSFTFATPIVVGTAYAVTVSAQPAGETCAVAGGSGTMAAANVTTVAVTCTANTYFIGGTITGLTAPGLTLANGSDSVSPVANATSFAFPTHLTAGSAYAVTVSQQPAGFNCLIGNGSGTVAGNVSNITVTCTAVPVAGWSTPAQIGTGVYPAIANDPSAVAFFVNWWGGTATGIASDATAPDYASRYTDAGGWTTPAALPGTQGRTLHGMQFDGQGRGFALWSMVDSSGTPSVMFSRYYPATGWTSATAPFTADTLPSQFLPPGTGVGYYNVTPIGLTVGTDGSASAIVNEDVRLSSATAPAGSTPVWWTLKPMLGGAVAGADLLQFGGSADLLIPPSDLTPQSLLDPASGTTSYYFAHQTLFAYFPAFKASPLPGHYAVIYDAVVQAPLVLANGAIGVDRLTSVGVALHTGAAAGSAVTLATQDLLLNNVVVRLTDQSIALGPNGDALVTWSVITADLKGVTVYAMRYTGGGWQSPQVITSSQGASSDYSGYSLRPVAGLDAAGNGMVAVDVLGNLVVARMDAKTGLFTLGAPLAALGGGGETASLQLDAAGNAFLLEDAGASALVRHYSVATGAWDAATFTTNITASFPPVLALDNGGNALLAWMQGGKIMAARYH